MYPFYRGENQDREQVICLRSNLGCIRTELEPRKSSSIAYITNNDTVIWGSFSNNPVSSLLCINVS